MKPFSPMTIAELEATLGLPEKIFGNELLSWFAGQAGTTVHRNEFTFANKKTYRFCASINGVESLSGFGRSQDELVAAVKACAEAIERKVYGEAIKYEDLLNLQLIQNSIRQEIEPIKKSKSISPSFHNSNGWAVGFSSSSAIERAKIEALERHLLLLTFIKDGWAGFYEINRVIIEDVEFISLLSRYSLAGYSAGIGIARSKKFNGVSFGYICDKTENIKTSAKWEQGFYESFDYIRVRSEFDKFSPAKDLISQNLNYFLESDFNENFLAEPSQISLGDSFQSNLAVFDLAKSFGLEFPFFAAVVHGQDLLPLYFKKSLSLTSEEILKSQLAKHGIHKPLPERHPIL